MRGMEQCAASPSSPQDGDDDAVEEDDVERALCQRAQTEEDKWDGPGEPRRSSASPPGEPAGDRDAEERYVDALYFRTGKELRERINNAPVTTN